MKIYRTDGSLLYADDFDSLKKTLEHAVEERATLNGAILDNAILDGARLDGANLNGARLVGANLDGARLDGANLVCARLNGASLVGASLVGASLNGARLNGASLVGASLGYAKLNNASLDDAQWAMLIERYHPPIIADIDRVILSEIEADGNALEMNNYHVCKTTHCRAGWAIHKAGEAGYALERSVGPWLAGALIYKASRPDRPVPDFFATNEEAMADIRRCAETA